VFSIGDLLIGMGGAWFVLAAMHGPQLPATASAAPHTPTTGRMSNA
jgi:hypothetical protein